MFKKVTLVPIIAAFSLAASSTFAFAQQIVLVGGGRTTLTLSNAFQSDLTKAKIAPTAVAGSQLYNNQIDFPVSIGSVNLDNAAGEIVHNGGILLTSGKTQVRLTAFLLNTIGEDHYITGLVEVNDKFLGRVKLVDLTLPSDLQLPIQPKDGDFFLSGVKWNLDPDGAATLNDAFGTTVFTNNLFIGNSLSLVLVPLSADATVTPVGE